MSNNANNFILGSAASNTLTNQELIQGSGSIQTLGIVNGGTLLANQSTPLLILPSTAGLNNTGTLNVATGSTMKSAPRAAEHW